LEEKRRHRSLTSLRQQRHSNPKKYSSTGPWAEEAIVRKLGLEHSLMLKKGLVYAWFDHSNKWKEKQEIFCWVAELVAFFFWNGLEVWIVKGKKCCVILHWSHDG
jgi:hypothetical protein